MKRLIVLVAAACAVVVLMSGCAVVGGVAGGTYGGIYTSTSGAVAVGTADGSDKVGTATSTAIVCFATGDSSIKAAMDNGGITKIHHVDCKVMSVLGVYAKYTTVVYGQ
ncbi:MAG TPA: TRL domain-containing protein [Verrucomicrobiae bacterium]|nr:TRL domain-containing protein [Verrucomicrobiae bacterium]